MKYAIKYIKSAKVDIAEIKSNLSQYYPSTPLKFLKTLKESIEVLGDNPLTYPVYEWHTACRKMPVRNYVVFYKVFEDTQTVEIHRVLYGKRNVKEVLGESS
ncbi:MAG: type II toxin-antitoxin system RelE/ParE family toxin [Oscillospiraceae bacterium]|nr:type II toxin-antitoxin system RelE/ParE family toxin [Oscillospiraceae bacterium]